MLKARSSCAREAGSSHEGDDGGVVDKSVAVSDNAAKAVPKRPSTAEEDDKSEVSTLRPQSIQEVISGRSFDPKDRWVE